jgi:hypothetical protein
MSMKPENKFRLWFIERFREYVLASSPHARFRATKHADYANAGVLDMDLAINGMTIWIEFKLIPQCVKERKLDVSDLQKDELHELTQAGVSASVLVGLPLGPRKGYAVALLDANVPTHLKRSDFGPAEAVFSILYAKAYVSSEQAYNRFKSTALV